MSEGAGRNAESGDLLAAGPEGAGDGPRAGRPRWIWRVAGLLVLGVVAVVAGPQLLSSPSPPPPPPGPSAQSAPLVRPGAPGAVRPLRWAPRGSEVGSDFAAAALARMRAQRPDVDRLLWAGSLNGHDHAVVVCYRRNLNQSPDDPIEVAALRVERLSDLPTADTMTIGYVRDADSLVGLAWRDDDQRTRLLVLGPPASTHAQLSTAIDYHPDGTVSRRWQDADLTDGVALVDLAGHIDPVIVIRATNVSSDTGVARAVVNPRAPAAADEVTVAGVSSPSYAGPAARVLVRNLAMEVGSAFHLRDADSRVLWSGKVPGGPRGPGERTTGRAALILVKRHDGPALQVLIYYDQRTGSSSSLAVPVRWSAAGLAPLAFSAPEQHAPLVLVNPGGPGSATIVPDVGPRQRVRLDRFGLALLAADADETPPVDNARVEVRDPSGHPVVTVEIDIPAVGAFAGIRY